MTRRGLTQWPHRHRDALVAAAGLPIAFVARAPTGHWPTAADLILALLAGAPLIVRVRWPLQVAATVVLADTVHIAIAGDSHPAAGTWPYASMVALYTVSTRFRPRLAWSSAAIAAALQFTVAALRPHDDLGTALLYLNWALVSAVVGQLVRERRDRVAAAEQRAEAAEQTKESEAQRQVINERMRIARELHDMLAHHLTVVNAQAGVAQYLLKTDPAAAEQALAGITDNTQDALNDLRATLGLLRADRDSDSDTPGDDLRRAPAPGLTQLPALVETFTTNGAAVTVRTRGTPRPLSAAADLALYRIIQEALTNAVKHAPRSAIDVAIKWTAAHVDLQITNTKSPAPPSPWLAEGTGHGLIGMRERAAAAGGTLTSAPTPGSGYQVAATLPLTGTAERDPAVTAPRPSSVSERS